MDIYITPVSCLWNRWDMSTLEVSVRHSGFLNDSGENTLSSDDQAVAQESFGHVTSQLNKIVAYAALLSDGKRLRPLAFWWALRLYRLEVKTVKRLVLNISGPVEIESVVHSSAPSNVGVDLGRVRLGLSRDIMIEPSFIMSLVPGLLCLREETINILGINVDTVEVRYQDGMCRVTLRDGAESGNNDIECLKGKGFDFVLWSPMHQLL